MYTSIFYLCLVITLYCQGSSPFRQKFTSLFSFSSFSWFSDRQLCIQQFSLMCFSSVNAFIATIFLREQLRTEDLFGKVVVSSLVKISIYFDLSYSISLTKSILYDRRLPGHYWSIPAHQFFIEGEISQLKWLICVSLSIQLFIHCRVKKFMIQMAS